MNARAALQAVNPLDTASPAALSARTAPAAQDIAVDLRGVSKRFGETVALHQLDLQIGKGEFFSLLGASGCGKTTTLNLIGGFEAASSGTLLIDGQPVHDVPPHRRPVNTVFQNYALFPHMNVAENVEFGLRMKRIPSAQRRDSVAEMLRLVSLEGYDRRHPGQLSGGQRQRVALARALINRPSVLLLDEPLGALDLKLRKQMQAELTRIQRQVGITFVYVTHDQEEALAMSDRIAVMQQGRLLQVGTPAQIYDTPACREVMEFIGSANVFDGRCVHTAGAAEIDLPGLGRVRAHDAEALPAGAAASVLVRPERIRMSCHAPLGVAAALPGTVIKLAHLGFVSHCTVRLDGGQQVLVFRLNHAERGADEAAGEGQRVFLCWNADDARAFPADDSLATAGAPNVPGHSQGA